MLLFAFGFIAGMVVATLSVIFALAMAGAASRGDDLLDDWLRSEDGESGEDYEREFQGEDS